MRGFTVIAERKGKVAVSYPASGCKLLSGDKALGLMRTMKQRGLRSIARTSANGITEDLTLADMETIYSDGAALVSNRRQTQVSTSERATK